MGMLLMNQAASPRYWEIYTSDKGFGRNFEKRGTKSFEKGPENMTVSAYRGTRN